MLVNHCNENMHIFMNIYEYRNFKKIVSIIFSYYTLYFGNLKIQFWRLYKKIVFSYLQHYVINIKSFLISLLLSTIIINIVILLVIVMQTSTKSHAESRGKKKKIIRRPWTLESRNLEGSSSLFRFIYLSVPPVHLSFSLLLVPSMDCDLATFSYV